jgi:hypothetical protein
MNRLGIDTPRSAAAYTVEEAERIGADLSYPVVIRPAYTMWVARAAAKSADIDVLSSKTHLKRWFIVQMKELVDLEEEILKYRGRPLPDALLVQAKKDGTADRYLARLLDVPETEIRRQRTALGVVETWDAVPVSGVEDAAYCYSTYNGPDRVPVSTGKPKVMVLGGGPNRIGQGIEFDYCCVHAAFARPVLAGVVPKSTFRPAGHSRSDLDCFRLVLTRSRCVRLSAFRPHSSSTVLRDLCSV